VPKHTANHVKSREKLTAATKGEQIRLKTQLFEVPPCDRGRTRPCAVVVALRSSHEAAERRAAEPAVTATATGRVAPTLPTNTRRVRRALASLFGGMVLIAIKQEHSAARAARLGAPSSTIS
jgi:hypothetical protein